jgi:hypothetical protein
VIPFVVFRVELEGAPRYRIVAESEEDERALLVWLAGPAGLMELAMAVHGLLDRLEDEREGAGP